MENKAKGDKTELEQRKPKVLVVIFYPDGRTIVNNVDATKVEVRPTAGNSYGPIVASVEFESVPKRLQFFLEKWGKAPEGKTVLRPKQESIVGGSEVPLTNENSKGVIK